MLKISKRYPRVTRDSTILNVAYGQDRSVMEFFKDNSYKIKLDTSLESQLLLETQRIVLRKHREQTKFNISTHQK